MATQHRKTVAVTGDSFPQALWQSLTVLSELFPINFQPRGRGTWDGAEAVIVAEDDLHAILGLVSAGTPAYVIMDSERGGPERDSDEVRFCGSSSVDACLRSQTLRDSESRLISSLHVQDGDECLAVSGEHPVWIRRRAGSGHLDMVATELPGMGSADYLRDHFRAGRFMGLMPLVSFLKRLTVDIDWKTPPIPACLVFDDASLCSMTYGFLNFEQLARLTQSSACHVAVATVPLTCRLRSKRVVQVFRENAPRLSLLLHGNNHTREELGPQCSSDLRLSLLAQALKRWEYLEREKGLELCRVMQAPHGVLAAGALPQMASLGFEAALASPFLFASYNPHAGMPRTLGMDRADLPVAGLPLIPLIKLTNQWRTDVLLAAFLRQPIVLVGHHTDAIDGLRRVAEVADAINRLEDVVWVSPSGISRSSYKQRQKHGMLHLKLYARRISVMVPEGVDGVVIHRPWLHGSQKSEALVVTSNHKERFRGLGTDVTGPVSVTGGKVLEVYSPPPKPIDYRTVPAPRTGCWPVIRKVLTETRDRTAPWHFRGSPLNRNKRPAIH
ncbi:MAG TPA: hypothetical protein VMP11_20060 [Verrucomicrobiae bacterium]|nr:hypothetical protein [Verrucomicrobiae bacterium]